VIAKHFGPTVGGLFLAFPAIFPASASLIENHEKQVKAEAGFNGTIRGRIAASVDASGASLGCVGLIVFAVILWKGLPAHNAYAVILLAMVCWFVVSTLLRALRRKRVFHSNKSHSSGLTSARN
jgi:Flp pilus assembly protein TadB